MSENGNRHSCHAKYILNGNTDNSITSERCDISYHGHYFGDYGTMTWEYDSKLLLNVQYDYNLETRSYIIHMLV